MTAPVLLVLAHPALHRSRANALLARAVSDLDTVEVHDLYETYPDYLIDAPAEQARVANARALVFQHPMYWYAAPSLLKEWFDLVLTHGFAYGAGKRALHGKPWMTAITTGGLEDDYSPAGRNRYTVDELLRPFEATASLCGCAWRAPFVLHGGRQLSREALDIHARAYRGEIEAIARAVQERTP